MSLGLSIPLYNEAEGLKSTTQDLLDALRDTDATIILVNNGSTDATPMLVDDLAAQHAPLSALHLQENAGYGGGILAGLQALLALPSPPEVIGWMWGDNQINPTILPALYRHCAQGAAMAKARRTIRQDGLQRRLITSTYALTMRRAVGVMTPDVNGCPKLFQTTVLRDLALSSEDWFLDAEAVLKLEQHGLPIRWEPATMRPRQAGASNVNWKTVAEFIKNISRQQWFGKTN